MVKQGRILKGIGGFYYVEAEETIYECKARGVFRKRGTTPLAGDWVQVCIDNDTGTIEEIFYCIKPVYIFATANSLSGIPKEFFRSGRFDSHFALYMPTRGECIDIFKKRMEKAESIVSEYNKQDELFMKQCFDDDKLGLVVDHLLFEENGQKKGRFITGADITKLVNMALRQFTQRTGAISHTDWINALKRVSDSTIMYGDGNENLDSIAVCYLRMMRLGFTPTSDDCLFSPKDYAVEYTDEGISISISEKSEFKSDYDRVLYQTIREKMVFMAAKLEENAIIELIR